MMSTRAGDLDGLVQVPVTMANLPPTYMAHTSRRMMGAGVEIPSPSNAVLSAANAVLLSENWGAEQLNPLSVSTSPLSASLLGALGGSPDSSRYFLENPATQAANLFRAQHSHASAFPPRSGMQAAPPSYAAHITKPQNGSNAPMGLPTYSAHVTSGGGGRGGGGNIHLTNNHGVLAASTPTQQSHNSGNSLLAYNLISDVTLGARSSKRARDESDEEDAPTPTIKLKKMHSSILAMGNNSPYVTGLNGQTPAELKALAGTPRNTGMSIPMGLVHTPLEVTASAMRAAAAAFAAAEQHQRDNPGSDVARKAVATAHEALTAQRAIHAAESTGSDGPPPASPLGRGAAGLGGQPPPLQGIVDLKSPGSPTVLMKSPSRPGSGGSNSSSAPSSPLLDAVAAAREQQEHGKPAAAAATSAYLQAKLPFQTTEGVQGAGLSNRAAAAANTVANAVNGAMTASEDEDAATKARGNYKCGTCGFAPKRKTHDCIEVNRQRIAASTAEAALQAAHEAHGVAPKKEVGSGTVGGAGAGAGADSKDKKRGGYKCGVCGFFPKKTVHDCAAVKIAMKKEMDLQAQRQAESGIDPHAKEGGRGGYKCGNCGFFPKKTEHDCDLEKLKVKEVPLPIRGSYKCGDCGFKPKKAPHDCEAIRKANGQPPLQRNVANPFINQTKYVLVAHHHHPTAAIATMATMAQEAGRTQAIWKDGNRLSPTALPKP